LPQEQRAADRRQAGRFEDAILMPTDIDRGDMDFVRT